jgi:hypothetical protein
MKIFFTLLPLLFAAALRADDTFTIPWSTLSGGGIVNSTPAPGEFTLTGATIGQLASDSESGGPPGEFDLTEGYWTFAFEPSPDLHLTMQLSGGTVTLTWDQPAAPVILESSADLELWAPLNPQPATPFFQEPEGARKFYRLVPGE